MTNVTFPVQLAPGYLDQPILPGWQLSLFNVDLGHSSDPDVERQVIDEVGSYGKQLGHLAEALEIVIQELGLMDRAIDQHRRDALQIFLGDVAATRKLKPAHAKAQAIAKTPPDQEAGDVPQQEG